MVLRICNLEPILNADPMSAISASSIRLLHPGKPPDNTVNLSFGGVTSPSLETIEPPSSGESFSIDGFLSQVRVVLHDGDGLLPNGHYYTA